MSENAHDFRTVREATLEILRQLGLTTIFSNPSHTEMKLFEDWPDDFRFVMGLQEASVVGMADGYAQATGQASLVIINGGPGLGNAMGSVYTAATAHTPMVILGGQQARKMVAGEPFLNARHATQLPQPYIKWAGEPARPQDVPALLVKAFHIANQAPQGPVFVAVPEDDWVRPASPDPLPKVVRSAVVPDPAALRELADVLNRAERPGLVAGPTIDAQGARGDLIALAEKLNARVWGAPVWPRSSFPENHPLFGGVLPPIPELISAKLEQHDVVVVLGSPTFTLFTCADLFSTEPAGPDLSDQPRLPAGTEFYHLTDNPEAAAWSMAGTSYVLPPGPAVTGLIPLVQERPKVALPPTREPIPVPQPSEPLTQAYLFHLVAQELPEDAVLFEELPIARADFHEQIPLGADNGYFATASGALGFPFAGAVGYALARPERRAVAVMGEGSAQYTLHALWTAAQHRLPVTYIIPNNSGYLSLKYYLQEQESWRVGWDLPDLDMAALARGFGVPSERIETPEQLREALKSAFTVDGPVLLDVVVADPGLFRL
ncbi:benzoylformate decarboxylase [Kitasatospora sp. NBC_01250]|uniref:benzoylformate decarboxylase n=1 Tax=unclassified Kitasatospora TaxID=2633591 RepID=UPI002E15D75D|nr:MULTISPECIES: benzoylformate decarboxylase [unclassified Kitasatospora]WSJ70913.1 benzoylformate decarboxylase [Kitasatospora sp. NBC_01302]